MNSHFNSTTHSNSNTQSTHPISSSTSSIYHSSHPSHSSSQALSPSSPISVSSSSISSSSSSPFPSTLTPNRSVRSGIERIDGLLLRNYDGSLYEINLETPETLEDVYQSLSNENMLENIQKIPLSYKNDIKILTAANGNQKMNTSSNYITNTYNNNNDTNNIYNPDTIEESPVFSTDTFISRDLEETIKEAFQAGDWDDDDDNDDNTTNGNNQYIQCDSGFTNVPKFQRSKHFLPAFIHHLQHPYHHTLIKAYEYLQKHVSPTQIHLYNQYRNAQQESYQQEQQQQQHQQQQQYQQYKQQQQQQLLSLSIKPTFLPALPLPKIPMNVQSALSYNPNYHSMFCITMRDVTKHVAAGYSDIHNDNNLLYNKNNNLLYDKNNNNNNITTPTTDITTTTTNNNNNNIVYDESTSSQFLPTSPPPLCGIAFCRTIPSEHMKTWINKSKHNNDRLLHYIHHEEDLQLEKQHEKEKEKKQYEKQQQQQQQQQHNHHHHQQQQYDDLSLHHIRSINSEELREIAQNAPDLSNSIDKTANNEHKLICYCPIVVPASQDNNINNENNTTNDVENDLLEALHKFQIDDTTTTTTTTTATPATTMVVTNTSDTKHTPTTTTTTTTNNNMYQHKNTSENPLFSTHWMKIELISLLPQHRGKGLGHLLLMATLLAGSLTQRFKNSHTVSQRINNAVLSLAGGAIKNQAGHHLYTNHGFVPILKDYFDSPNHDLYVLLDINKEFCKIHWNDLIAGMHNVDN